MVPWLALSGLGIAFVFTPLLVAVLRTVAPADSPKAGAFMGLALNLGGSVASASLVTVLDRRETFHGSVLGDAIGALEPSSRRGPRATKRLCRVGEPRPARGGHDGLRR